MDAKWVKKAQTLSVCDRHDEPEKTGWTILNFFSIAKRQWAQLESHVQN